MYNSLQMDKKIKTKNPIKIEKGEKLVGEGQFGDQLLENYFDLKDYNPMNTDDDHKSSRLS